MMILLILLLGLGRISFWDQQEEPKSTQISITVRAVLREQVSDKNKTQILILGTFHFRQLGEGFRPDMVDSLIAALEKYKPDVIAVESPPGCLIDKLKNRMDDSSLVSDVLNSFAGKHLRLGEAAQKQLDISYAEAERSYQKFLSEISDDTKSSQMSVSARCRLVLVMLAAYDLDSALLQWSYLNEETKHRQDIISKTFTEILEKELNRINETPALSIRLARKMGLQRLYPVDDYEDLDAVERILPLMEREFPENEILKSVRDTPIYLEAKLSLDEAAAEMDLLPHFLFLNTRKYADADVQAQWGAYLRTNLESGIDRTRLGLWETRNLKIASRIRTISAMHPGRRLLIVFGSAHRPFLEAYLNCLSDIHLISLADLL